MAAIRNRKHWILLRCGGFMRNARSSRNPALPVRSRTRVFITSVVGEQDDSALPEKSNEPTGSVLGAVALITGSTVGAGMLALPATTVTSGFLPSSGVMTLTWGFQIVTALLMAEVNLSLMKQRRDRGESADVVVSQRQMARETLGPWGARVTSFVYPLLSYTLLVAYIAKGGEIVNLLSMDTIPVGVGGPVFSLLMGGVMLWGSTKSVDLLNRALTAGLVVLFGVLLSGGACSAHWDVLLQHQDWNKAWAAFPLIFMVLVFHDLIPVLCSYLEGDKARVRSAIVVGGLVPLVMYLAWDGVALALVPGAQDVIAAGGIIDPLRVLIETQGPSTGIVIGVFSLLAVVTSFIGCMLGFSEYIRSELREFAQPGEDSVIPRGNQGASDFENAFGGRLDKLAAISMAVGPPTAAAFINPDLFYIATQVAGGYGMTLLYGFLPPLMAWHVRPVPAGIKGFSQKVPLVPGGRPVLASVASCAAALEVGKLAGDTGGILNTLSAVSAQVGAMASLLTAHMAAFEASLGNW